MTCGNVACSISWCPRVNKCVVFSLSVMERQVVIMSGLEGYRVCQIFPTSCLQKGSFKELQPCLLVCPLGTVCRSFVQLYNRIELNKNLMPENLNPFITWTLKEKSINRYSNGIANILYVLLSAMKIRV